MEKIVEGVKGNGDSEEFGSKYIKFVLFMRRLSRDVKWKVECFEGKREVGNIGVVSK